MAFMRDPDHLHRGVGAIAASDGVAGHRRVARRARAAQASAARDRARARLTYGARGSMGALPARTAAMPTYGTAPNPYLPTPMPSSPIGVRQVYTAPSSPGVRQIWSPRAPSGSSITSGGLSAGGGSGSGFTASTWPTPAGGSAGSATGSGSGTATSGGGGSSAGGASSGTSSGGGYYPGGDGGGAGLASGVVTPVDVGPILDPGVDMPPLPPSSGGGLIDQVPTWAKIAAAALGLYLLTRED
jgi:hypothetical protein